ncbi:GIY-YIG domain-containing protein [Flavobacterium longum]|uniref:GIY-YIG nuclease family protein n=1 Tax=Flavobacterium longum TaxID=1299340 RepID=UPI0039EB8A68
MPLTYVYLLKCADQTYYTGITISLETRLRQHQIGTFRKCYTFKRRPIELVYCCVFTDPQKAVTRKDQIKKWSQAKKEALIAANYQMLPGFSKKRF